MATLDQLKSALVNAHNAGDTEAATTLANEIMRMQQTETSVASAQPQQYQRKPVEYSADPEAAAFGEWAFQNPQAAKELAKKGLETTALVGTGLITRNPLYAGAAYAGAKQLEYGLEDNRVPNEAARLGVDVATGTALDILPKAVLGAGKIAVNKAVQMAAPTVEKLKTVRDAAYDRFVNSGLNFDFSTVLPDLKQKMISKGFNAIDYPKLAPAMARIEELISRGTALTAQEVKKLREVFNKATSGEQGMFANELKTDLDTAIAQVDPQAAKNLLEGVESHRALVNSQKVERIVKQAERSKSGNEAEIIKNKLDNLLQKSSGFTQAEKNELARIAQGTPTQSGMQKLGTLSPGGSFMPQISQFGYGAGAIKLPIPTGILAGTTLASKGAVNTLVKSEANALAARMRAGGGAQIPESVVRRVETYAPAGLNMLYNPFANQGQQ